MANKTTDQSSAAKVFKYPYYPLSSALRLSAAVKDLGGARTPVKKSLLARQMETAENAASFTQALTSAKIFGVVEGYGDYSLTEISKRYHFPTTETDKALALLDAFASPEAFAELLKRFDGDKLPSRDILGNILHRDLGIPDSWKDRVAALFANSAQEVGVVDGQGFLRYDAARHVSGGSATSNAPAREEEKKVTPPKEEAGQPKSLVRIEGAVFWRYKTIEVLTPENLDRALWQKLESYVKLLEPTE